MPKLFSKAIWKMPSNERCVYLTFDDGPTPEVTDFVLSELDKFQAKATFFLIGKNIEAYPTIFKKIVDSNHSVGNHTQNHQSGWNITCARYVEEAEACDRNYNFRLFRPPYGKLTWNKYQTLSKKYTIVMWDILTGDFDTSVDGESCFQNTIRNIENGSIIVLHDSMKAFPRLKVLLPKLLKYLKDNQYEFKKL